MKTLVPILLALAVTAAADDLPLKNGGLLRNVSIISAEPTRMLVVHDGGGEYVSFSSLAANALNAAQREDVERLVKIHVARQARMDEARAIKQAENRTMSEAGFVKFEGYWMKPTDIEGLLQMRRTAALERRKLQLEIAKEEAELAAQNERARQLLDEGRSRGTAFISVGYGVRRHGGPYSWGCYSPSPVRLCPPKR